MGMKSTWGPPSNSDLFHNKGMILTPCLSFPTVGRQQAGGGQPNPSTPPVFPQTMQEESPSPPRQCRASRIALASLARKTRSARAWRLLAPKW